MYIPTSFAGPQNDAAQAFLGAHPFATLISDAAGTPHISHVPLLVEDPSSSQLVLLGHLARANPQAKSLDDAHAVAIFQGPHAYVSPRWYVSEGNPPTWNYGAACARGTVSTINERQGALEILQRLITTFEPQEGGWKMDQLDRDQRETLLQAIVPFRLVVDDLQVKFKLSQNKSEADRLAVAAQLEAGGEMARAVGTMMRDAHR
jgi:transcriptional regulator